MLKIKDAETFKKAIDQIAVFVDECNIHFNHKGIHLTAFDTAQIIYLEYALESSGIEGDLEPTVFGINIGEFNKILSKIGPTEEISLDIKEKTLDLIVTGIYSRNFSYPQKIVDDKKLEISLEKYPVLFDINCDIVKDIFNCAKLVSDGVVFDIRQNDINVLAEGIYGRYRTKIKSIQNREEGFKAKFSSQHLHNMLKNTNPETKIKIRLSQRDPFYLEYALGQNHLCFYLAHRFI